VLGFQNRPRLVSGILCAAFLTILSPAKAQTVMVDGTGTKQVGTLIAPGEVIRSVGGTWVQLTAPDIGSARQEAVSSQGFYRFAKSDLFQLFYASSNCSGQAYVKTETDTPTLGIVVSPDAGSTYTYGTTGTLYYAALPRISFAYNSVRNGPCEVGPGTVWAGPLKISNVGNWGLTLPFKLK
jgi:hypothetical protein